MVKLALVLAFALLAGACSGSDASNENSTSPPEADGSLPCDSRRMFSEAIPALNVDPLGAPVWTMATDEATFSSPRTADLNNDGVLDVVQGLGQDTFGARQSSVIATDGTTGAELWRSTGYEDLIGSAVFASLGGDATLDVVIGGRRGALVAFDGATGEELWQFDDQGGRWFNFYTSQIVVDQNNDGVVDVVAANGGLVINEPEEGGGLPDPDERQLGTMFIISGLDGSVISSTRIGDQRESYMSPVLIPGVGAEPQSSAVDVLVGTGGETLPGSLWRLPLESLVNGNFDGAAAVLSGNEKGIIAPPSLAHLTDDCALDIVVQAFDGTISAVDGVSNEVLWTVDNPGFETYSSPSLGYFVSDDHVPDVFAAVARGVWPEYESSDYLLIDGATGQVTWRETLGTFAPSGFVAVDLDGDGRDEVIFGVNDLPSNTLQIYVLEPSRGTLHELGAFEQTAFASPWLGDIDDDGMLDLLITESAYQSSGAARTHRYELAWFTPESVSWGGYLGTNGTGAITSGKNPGDS